MSTIKKRNSLEQYGRKNMIKVNEIAISDKQHSEEIIDEQKQPPEVVYEKRFRGKRLC